MAEITIKFPNEEEKRRFLGWLSDGGGEYEFMEYTETEVNRFTYSGDIVELLVLCPDCGLEIHGGHTCQ